MHNAPASDLSLVCLSAFEDSWQATQQAVPLALIGALFAPLVAPDPEREQFGSLLFRLHPG